MSSWVRFHKVCGQVIDDRGSCSQCATEGTQPGHFACYGRLDETVEWATYADYGALLDTHGRCQCQTRTTP